MNGIFPPTPSQAISGARNANIEGFVVATLRQSPGLNQRDLESRISGFASLRNVRTAIRSLTEGGSISEHDGRFRLAAAD